MLKSIPIDQYRLAPHTYDLPRAMAALKAGDMVVFAPTHDVYPIHHPDVSPNAPFGGVAMAATFPYGVALIASQVVDHMPVAVWVVDSHRNDALTYLSYGVSELETYSNPEAPWNPTIKRDFIDDAIEDALNRESPDEEGG